MASYTAPLRDMRFVYHELMDGAALRRLPGYEEIDAELVDSVLEEAAKFCEQELVPLNRPGDEEGCRFVAGEVFTPKGFKEAYAAFTAAGWSALAFDPAYGGQGLPKSLSLLVDEMLCASNVSFWLYVSLTHGAYQAMRLYADEELKARYFPKMAAGAWSGTMCLTEPHCGTDLGLLRTRAEPAPDGSYRITGTKIFITGGEHDLTENIVHLVLARLPDAPPGIKGISLFLVPKFLVHDDGSLGARNAVSCGAIEHKMGIQASATCVMNFDGATGYLIGEPHRGMRAMFAMMNTERLAMGLQAIGHAEAAYQGALAWARERLQGRAAGGAKHPEQPADPLIVHPDVRRMLLTQRALVQGMRATAAWVGEALDVALKASEAERRQQAEDFLALMTPIVKGFFTDLGFECANLGVQVMGGHGYIREHGMEQHVRDARIAQIYEGANGIQAMDLAARKLPMHEGRLAEAFFRPVNEFIAECASDARMAEFVAPLKAALERLRHAVDFVLAQREASEVGAAAYDLMHLFGYTVLAYQWAKMARIGLAKEAGEEAAFYRAKVETARFYMQRILPRSEGLAAALRAGGRSIMAFDDAGW
ncbi:MAG: acyl-CoA dehydrogenase C-terminal domain-containing protein [Rhodocyclaceae bacterium]|nr:acyl-CoA dehydrogenase C-terminal domain-containing protein [Rhodocyclaceae bacterium]